MSDQIHHWGSYFGVLDAAQGGTRTLEEHAHRNPNGQLERDPPAEGPAAPNAKKAVAVVSGSCWIALCPSGDGGAEFVNFEDPRFFCCNCRNRQWGGKPLRMVLPDPAVRLQVETVLLKRPDPATRNWEPGESVEDLKVENLSNGVAP